MTPKRMADIQAKALEKKAADLCLEARELLRQADEVRKPHFSDMERILAQASAEVSTWPADVRRQYDAMFNRPEPEKTDYDKL